MSRRYRTRRAELAVLTHELRAEGRTWPEIARRIASEHHVNMRVAFRLAHGMTQDEVAIHWDNLFPAADGGPGMTAQRLSYWETWPQSGRQPSLTNYMRLAQIYQCNVADLIEGGDYSHLDEAANNIDDAYWTQLAVLTLTSGNGKCGKARPAMLPLSEQDMAALNLLHEHWGQHYKILWISGVWSASRLSLPHVTLQATSAGELRDKLRDYFEAL